MRALPHLVLLAVPCALGLWGCTSRTLPLPPPTIDQVGAPDANGMVTVRGLAHEGAAVGVLNEETFQGTIVTSAEEGCENSCPYEATLAAEPGDGIRAWQFFETEGSEPGVVPGP